jgi:hypothetical protein
MKKNWAGNNNGQTPPALRDFKITPMGSFKTFIELQQDDLPPEKFQQQYDAYTAKYLEAFSDAFFKASVGEEWFRERYDPSAIMQSEKEAAIWAGKR